MYLNRIVFAETSAGATYGRCADGPVQISAGSKKSRLHFSAAENNDSLTEARVTSVYTEIIGKGVFQQIKACVLSLMDCKFVKCTRDGKTIYINVNSLSKRLGIPHEKILSTKSEKKLDALISDHHQSLLETQAKVDAQFQKMITNKYTKDGDFLETSNGWKIASQDLHTALGIAAFRNFEEEEEVGLSLTTGTVLHLKKEGDKEWPIMTLFTERVLGKGKYGSVQVVQELSFGRVSVAKVAFNDQANEDAKNEYSILGKVKGVGIQERPYSLFNFKVANRKSNPTYQGYVAPLYESNLESALHLLRNDQKEECMRQLLQGLVKLSSVKICHGDIKLSNCLIRMTKDQSYEYVLADFGGSRQSDQVVNSPSVGTMSYMCENDVIEFRALRSSFKMSNTVEENQQISDRARALLMKRDVYAMGILMRQVMRGHIKFNGDILKARKIEALIEKMMDPSWEKRPSASEALAQFNDLFPKSNV